MSEAAAPSSSSLFGIEDLCTLMLARYSEEQIRNVQAAYALAEEAHRGQTRASGEAYIFHPIAVARIVVELGMDHRSVMAALLHDVIEDTKVERSTLADMFGEDVASLVDGLSKLTHLKTDSRLERQAENFRKMVLAMIDDIRVVIVKLADRLHNMRTLGAMSAEKRRRIARETLDVYAPIANRLGIDQFKNELEDLGFKALYPMRHRVLSAQVAKGRQHRGDIIRRVEIQLHALLEELGIHAEIHSREKHLYSLFNKMRTKQLPFQQVYDMFAMRVVVDSIDDCYRALGVLHGRFRPKPGLFKDYIAIPKQNGYQSLHTVMVSREGITFEAQIRTSEMDQFATAGVAAHWIYKTGDANASQRRARMWMSRLLDMQEVAASSIEFYENAKVDLSPNEILVFSPRGEIFRLPPNATPVDFAYAIHSGVGNRCEMAKIDKQLAPLSTPLSSGQTVEIITRQGVRPSPTWLNFVVTPKARSAIRHYLRTLDTSQAMAFGRRQLERALAQYNTSLDEIDPTVLERLLSEYKAEHLEQLLLDIGLGKQIASVIGARLIASSGETREGNNATVHESSILIEGNEGNVVSMARCCKPIPGDNVHGFLSVGKGVVVHRAGCRNVRRYRHRQSNWVAVHWADQRNENTHFASDILVELRNQPGTLARVTAVLSRLGVNIEDMRFKNSGERYTLISFTFSITDRVHLARIMRRLKLLPCIEKIKREML